MSSILKNHRSWLLTVGIAAIISLCIRLFLYMPYQVEGSSMKPSLQGNELMIINKWKYEISSPQYGDIVVFHTDGKRDLIKRVIGVPGDKILMKEGTVYRNGVELREPYIEKMSKDSYEEVEVLPNYIYVLGDNRNFSIDSRSIGLVKEGNIVGRADFIVYPINRLSYIVDDLLPQ